MSNGSWSAPPDGGWGGVDEDPALELGHRAARQHEPHPTRRAEHGHPPLPPERASQRAGPVPDERRLLEAPGLGQLGQPRSAAARAGRRVGWSGPRRPGATTPAVGLGLAGSGAGAQGHAELRGQARSARRGRLVAGSERLGAAPQRRDGLDGLDHGRGVLARRQRAEVERAVGPGGAHDLQPREPLGRA